MQVTRRGFQTAAEAAQARRELLGQVSAGRLKPLPAGTTVNELLDLYLGGLDADGRPSAKTRFDYRHCAGKYVRPHMGARRPRDVTPEVVLAWLAAQAGQRGCDQDHQGVVRQHGPPSTRTPRQRLKSQAHNLVHAGICGMGEQREGERRFLVELAGKALELGRQAEHQGAVELRRHPTPTGARPAHRFMGREKLSDLPHPLVTPAKKGC